ncbi:hypothetical protein PILCRDRAFT_91427 [Piloderma croceum F 1598]|uniref:BTB domain-containing protein n=1 Tax=Piloderma croceum (strain F 1598) TaxID=765440 RepID=A0A0C3AS93_PILCF|nr:hypothetical protein PILCRDRAFT_91427 [Piloderma croceum F 1598]
MFPDSEGRVRKAMDKWFLLQRIRDSYEDYNLRSPSVNVPAGPKHHPKYYFEDGNIIFLVENDLFCIHRHFFVRESVVFRDMLSFPSGSETFTEGQSDDRPIVLQNVKSIDFERMVWIFYNGNHYDYTASAEEWSSIISLTHMWQFEHMCEAAFRAYAALPNVSPAEKITMSQKYGFPRKHLADAYLEICSRDQPVSVEEVRKAMRGKAFETSCYYRGYTLIVGTKVPVHPKRHPKHYFEDGDVIFLVENVLFCVHRHFFVRESIFFRVMLLRPTGFKTFTDGQSDDRPIVLQNVKSIEFERILWMFYNGFGFFDPLYARKGIYSDYTASAEEWSSIISLAHMWQFEHMSEAAFKAYAALPNVSPVEKISLRRKYNFPSKDLVDAYVEICQRKYPLSVEEGDRIGVEALVLIAQIREQLCSKGKYWSRVERKKAIISEIQPLLQMR